MDAYATEAFLDGAVPLVAPDLLVATCDPDGTRLHANSAWVDLFGDSGGLWARLPDEDVRFAREYFTDAARGLLVTHQVFLVDRPKEDLPVPVLLHFIPVHTPDTEAGSFPVLVTGEMLKEPVSWAADQTRRRRMEMLGQMAMGIAHDFNNLLTTIIGHAELLRGTLPMTVDSEPRDHVETLQRAAADGAALVKKIQQYIRHEKQDRFEPVALDAIAEEVIALTKPYWHNEPRRQGIGITIQKDLRPAPPILGWPTEIREVLVNLVLNAVQAMPAGGRLHIATGADAQGNGIVEVEDTGVGMSARVRSRIFEPLFTTKGESGSGMGLTVSFGIVQEHNGSVLVDSEPGRGTRFRLTFPATKANASGAPSLGTPPGASTGASKPEAAHRCYRLLVVDDEPMVRTVTAKLLRLKGHTVEEVPGGIQALACLDDVGAEAFDLVITDLSMPDMNGRELAAAIRQRWPDLPIVLLTGDTDAQDGAELLDAVVQKPFKLDALDALIQELLSDEAIEPTV